MKPKKKSAMKAAALATLAESLNLNTSSEDFFQLEEALDYVPIAEDSTKAQEHYDSNDDGYIGACTPIGSQTSKQSHYPLPKKGNTFVVCGGCTHMVLFSAGEFNAPFATKHDPKLYNVIVFTYCKAYERSSPPPTRFANKLEHPSKLSLALFNQSRIATIPALIIEETVPFLSEGGSVQFVGFDDIMKRVGSKVKVFGIDTELKLDSQELPMSLLLPHLSGRFL